MKQKELIDIANRHYPDELVGEAYEMGDEYRGELLAQFIVAEMEGICDGYPCDDERLEAAEFRMQNASDELSAVADGFAKARRSLVANSPKKVK